MEPGGWGDFHLTLDTWFISQDTRLITPLGRGVRPPVHRSVIRWHEKRRRAHRARPESAGYPVHGLLRFPPARRAVTERELPRGPGGGAQPGGTDADQPQPRRGVESRALVQRARGRVDLPRHVGRLAERPRPGDRLEA